MNKKQLSSSTLLFRQGAMSCTFPVIIHERKVYNSLGTCTSIFSSDRSAGSAGNEVLGWSGWMARLRINAALKTCCVSSNTPPQLSSSGTQFHRQLFLFCSFLCLVQPQTSLNNWPWLYFTAEHILRFCTLVRSVKDQSHVKVPFDHVIELFKLYPLTAFSCTSSRSNLPYIWHNVV